MSSGSHRIGRLRPVDDSPLDLNHDGRVSAFEVTLAVVLGGAAFTGAVLLGAMLVLWACG